MERAVIGSCERLELEDLSVCRVQHTGIGGIRWLKPGLHRCAAFCIRQMLRRNIGVGYGSAHMLHQHAVVLPIAGRDPKDRVSRHRRYGQCALRLGAIWLDTLCQFLNGLAQAATQRRNSLVGRRQVFPWVTRERPQADPSIPVAR